MGLEKYEFLNAVLGYTSVMQCCSVFLYTAVTLFYNRDNFMLTAVNWVSAEGIEEDKAKLLS